MYFWISVSEDGEVRIQKMKREQVMNAINELVGDGEELNFLSDIPKEDAVYWHNEGTVNLLIKGNIVVPKPVELVTKYEV